MSRAGIREAVGYTFDELSMSRTEWRWRADGFRAAAEACFAADVPPPISMMLQGLALELLSKAVLVASGGVAPTTHDLHDLIQVRAGVPLSPDETAVVAYLSECVIWQGKYPTPIHPRGFDKFCDEYFEARTLRSGSGNNRSVRLNPARNPRDIQVVWSRLVAEYERLQAVVGQ